MQSHLTDDEWASGDAVEHLESCPDCRAQRAQLLEALEAFKADAYVAADRPEHFWQSQRASIREKLAATPNIRFEWLRKIWVPSFALLTLIVTFLVVRRDRPPVPDIAAGHDQELLLDIERSVRRELPLALEPLRPLAEELDRAAKTRAIEKRGKR